MLKRILLVVTLLCCATLCFGAMAANPPSKLGLDQLKQSNSDLLTASAPSKTSPPPVTRENFTILKQDSGKNFSSMNLTFDVTPTLGSAQTVEFTAPKPGWKLESILIMATDGWNPSTNKTPNALPFAVEIRDANLSLLYHFADAQFPYFTSSSGIRMANVEIPALALNGKFFVCFYGYRSLGLATELENASGKSYIFDKLTGLLHPATLLTRNNQTIPVNWLIRALGE